MAKKTRTELSTLAVNTNLPDNTSEQITPTTERAQLTEERASVINYKDDLGGTGNAGKFLTVAADGESLTMVDGSTGDVTGSGTQYQVAVWDGTTSLTGNAAFQFLVDTQNSLKIIRGAGSGNILFYASDGTTLHGYIENQVSGNGLTIGQQDGATSAVMDLDDSTITFKTDNNTALTIDSAGLATFTSTYGTSGGELTVGGSSTDFGIAIKFNQASFTSGTIYCSPNYSNNATTLKLGTGTNTDQLVLNGNSVSSFSNGLAYELLELKTSRTDANYGIMLYHSDSTLYGRMGGTGSSILSDASLGELVIRAEVSNLVLARGNSRRLTIGSDWTSNLDRYEEGGTWTVTLPNGGTIGSIVSSRYTIIGNMCHFSFYLNNISSIPNNSSDFYISLPVTPDTTGSDYVGANIAYSDTFDVSSWLPIIHDQAQYIYFHYNDGTSGNPIPNSVATGLTSIIMSGWYYV